MGLTLTSYASTGEQIDEDVYDVRFEHYTEPTSEMVCKYEDRLNPNCEKTVEKRSFYLSFSVIGGDFDGTKVRKKFTPSSHENSALYPFLGAMLGRPVAKGENVELDQLIGKRFRATVFTNQRGWPDIKNPLAAKKRAAPVATPVVADEEDDDSPPF